MSSSPSSRSALLASAVSFLRDPTTASSPLAQRIAFLESKGLSPQEIEHAMATASSSSVQPYQQTPYPRRRFGQGGGIDEFDRDWRDWFIMAVVGGGLGWVAVKLAQHLQTSTDSLTSSLEEQRTVVEADLVEVRKAVAEMREGEKKREEWAAGVGHQVDEVLKSLPGKSKLQPKPNP
ncbi:peroxin-14, partial [Phenoliferia sp. Uapishka_3]